MSLNGLGQTLHTDMGIKSIRISLQQKRFIQKNLYCYRVSFDKNIHTSRKHHEIYKSIIEEQGSE